MLVICPAAERLAGQTVNRKITVEKSVVKQCLILYGIFPSRVSDEDFSHS